MPQSRGVDGPGIAIMTIGGIFVYAALRGFSVLKAAQNLITGKSLSTGQQNMYPLSGSANSQGPGTSGSPAPKGSYDHAGLMKLWTSVGGSPAAANNAACHGMQESGGNPGITSANPDGGINVGLWQLDTKGKGAGHSVEQLKNPVTNARITVQTTGNGRDWSAWATPGC